ncbi:hypothetical protein QE363_003633 [Sphingomonas sp. SORGH_AS870]|nr:hypothetical protein [Sphingomonas sp. SORGH_AS_0870]
MIEKVWSDSELTVRPEQIFPLRPFTVRFDDDG